MTACPTDSLGRSTCAEFIRSTMAGNAAAEGLNCEITISTLPPLVASPYGVNGYECPHGTTYWIEPTGEQVAEWARDGVW